MLFEVHLTHHTSNEFSAVQRAPQWSADVTGLQAASRYFREHGSKKKGVRRVDEGDSGRKVRSQLLLKTLRRVHSRESAT